MCEKYYTLSERITSRLTDIKTMPDSETNPEETAELEKNLNDAKKLKEQLFRKTGKTRARYDLAVENLEALGGLVTDEK